MGFLSHLKPRDRRDWSVQREQMVDTQLRSREVADERVLAAMADVPRHLFVLPEDLHRAHDDCALKIGESQTISQPYIVGLMLEGLALTGAERVLEVGTGSGYQTALLSRLAAEVVSIERLEPLANAARERLEHIGGIDNVEIITGDGTLGCPERAPWDRIIITAAGPCVPEPLVEQLVDGGRLVTPVGERDEQMLVAIEKRGGETTSRDLCHCRFVPLIGKYGFSH